MILFDDVFLAKSFTHLTTSHFTFLLEHGPFRLSPRHTQLQVVGPGSDLSPKV